MAIQWSITLSDHQIALLVAVRDEDAAMTGNFPHFITGIRALQRENLIEHNPGVVDEKASKREGHKIVKGAGHTITPKGQAILAAIECDMLQLRENSIMLRNISANARNSKEIRNK